MRKTGLFIGLCLALAACTSRQAEVTASIPFVEAVLKSPESQEYLTLSAPDFRIEQGVVAVLDTGSRALSLGASLLLSDRFDNIDGASVQDLLPDLAGEDLYIYMSLSPGADVRTGAVQSVYRTLAGSFIPDPFLPDNREALKRAKLILLGETAMAGKALDDVRILLDGTGSGVQVVSPAESMLKKALEDSTRMHIGILATPADVASGVYGEVFGRVAPGSRARIYPLAAPDTIPDLLKAYLTAYMAAGHRDRLSALLVDDPTVPIPALNASLVDIMLTYNEENAVLGSVLDPDFEIIDGTDAAIRDICSILREKSWYTHRISAPRPSLFRIQGDAVVEYNEKSATEETDSLILSVSPELYEIYVQN